MPLGYLISVESEHFSDICDAIRESHSDQIFGELASIKKNSSEALETGRGHMPLCGYMLEHGELGAALHGEVLVLELEHCIIMANSPSTVVTTAARLNSLDVDALHTWADTYHQQIPHASPVPSKPRKIGFFERLFRKSVQDDPSNTIPSDNSADPSLVELFAELKSFYRYAASNDYAVIIEMEL